MQKEDGSSVEGLIDRPDTLADAGKKKAGSWPAALKVRIAQSGGLSGAC
jgi:hypothetical protein